MDRALLLEKAWPFGYHKNNPSFCPFCFMVKMYIPERNKVNEKISQVKEGKPLRFVQSLFGQSISVYEAF